MSREILALVCVAACGGDDGGGLTPEQLAGFEDGLDSIDTDGTIVDQVEVTLSGTVDPTASPDAAAAASVLAAKLRLTPSTCLESTVQGNVVTHVLTACTGAGRSLAGTITSTWTRDGACLHVAHATTSFTIGMRAATGSLGVTICRSGTTETRTRDLAFEATTRNDEPISLAGSWEITLDTTSNCAAQSGGMSGQIGGRAIDRTDDGLAWCTGAAKPTPLDEGVSVAKLTSGSFRNAGGDYDFTAVALGGGKFDIYDAEGHFIGGGLEGSGI